VRKRSVLRRTIETDYFLHTHCEMMTIPFGYELIS